MLGVLLARRISVVVVLGLVAVPAPAGAAVTCRSGKTEYRSDGARVFKVARGNDDRWYACARRSSRPVALYAAAANTAGFGIEGRKGSKLIFSGVVFGEGGSTAQAVGWFDTRTSQMRSGGLEDDDEARLLDFAVRRDGSLAIVGQTPADRVDPEAGPIETHVGFLPVARAKRDLKFERRLASVADPYVKGSLRLGSRTVSWRDRGGAERRTVPLTGESTSSCTAGTTLLQAGAARLFEVFRLRTGKTLLLACGAGETTPRRVASRDIGRLWRLGTEQRVGARVVFTTDPDGVGLLDASSGELHFGSVGQLDKATTEMLRVRAAAAAESGPVAVAAEAEGQTDQGYVGVIDVGGAPERFERLRRVATIGGELVAGSLAVREGRVFWKDATGDRSVALAGEGPVTCTSGTTIYDRDGIRIFETLDANADRAFLYGCQPGFGEPVALDSDRITAVWQGGVVAQENGRVLFWAASDTGFVLDRIVSFAPAAGSGLAALAHDRATWGSVRDATVLGDGTAALVYKRGKREFMFTYLGPGSEPGRLARERRLATRTDGFQPDSLVLEPGRVTWRDADGQPRSAAI